MKKLLLVIMLNILLMHVSYAQPKSITGTILDASDNQPLVGAMVMITGTNIVVPSNSDGKFSLKYSENIKSIKIVYIGYEEKIINLSNDMKDLTIHLKQSTQLLEEIVVVGYGTSKKSDLTGSVAQIKSKDLLKANPISIEQGMQGRLAGVNVVTNDGAPGSGISVQIRGTNSFLGGTEPLYVVDGIPITTSNDQESINFEDDTYSSRNALSFLNPKDIASIEVLKDASATAIYGSRGANGVIMITTKSGAGATKETITFDYGFTVSKVAKKIKMLGGREYAIYRNESAANTKIYNGETYTQMDLPFPGIKVPQGGYIKGPDDYPNNPYYWQNQIFRTGLSHDLNLTFSGNNKTMDYSISGGYIEQIGTVNNSDYTRYSLKIQLNKQIGKIIKIGTSTNLSFANSNMLKSTVSSQSNGTEGVIRSALMYPATYTKDDQIALDNEFGTVTTPSLYTEALNHNKNVNVYTSNYINVSLTKDLIFRSVLGYNFSTNNANQYWSKLLYEGRDVDGKAYAGDKRWESLVWDNLLMYNKSINKHNIGATLGTSWEEQHWYNKQISAQGFGTDLNDGWLLQNASVINTPYSNKGDAQLFSVILRATYNYNSKYYVTFTGRNDASSKFTKGKRSSFFPSIGVSYRISEEKFMKSISNIISNLKIRYSYGSSGNQSISSYQTYALMKAGNYPFGNNVSNGFTPDPSNPGNPDLKWETTKQHDVGLELGLFNNVNLIVDLYYKKTSDLLQYKEVASSTGLERILSNAGNVINKGLEIAINANIVNHENFKVFAGGNISFNRNKLTHFNSKPMFPNSLWNSLRPFALQDGHPIGSIYGFVEDGIWSSREEIINSKLFQNQYPGYTVASSDPATELIISRKWLGEIKYKDIEEDNSINDNDQTFIGNTNPDFFYGFNLDVQYKNFDLGLLFQGVYGNDIINMSLFRFYDIGNSKNIPYRIYKESWNPDNGGTAPKNFYDSGRNIRFSKRYLEDGSYLKLRNIQLAYTFNNPFKFVNKIRIYATGANLFTITKYSGYDPEVNSFGSDPSLRGIDSGGYPQPRSFIIGANIVF